MQIKKTYTATVDIGTSVSRTYSYGMTSKMNLDARTDYFNQTVADFLHDECGVDAAYGARGESEDKYLWIRGVPFLFIYAYNSSAKTYGYSLYVPYSTNAYMASGTSSLMSTTGNPASFSFSLLFSGNPNTAFALRWIPYNSTAISTNFTMMFYKAKNMLTGRNATVWKCGLSITTYGMAYAFNAVDLKEDGLFDENDYSTQTFYAQVILTLKNKTYSNYADKLLLIPIQVANWTLEGAYQHPTGCLPTPVAANIEHQTEVEIGGRKFMVTSIPYHPTFTDGTHSSVSPSYNSGYLNMGLIELTD